MNNSGITCGRPSYVPVLVFFVLFLLAIGSGWAWVNWKQPVADVAYWVQASKVIPGYRFESQPLSQHALTLLATPDILNGVFLGTNGTKEAEYRLFLASWQPKAGKGLSNVRHTPDICWVDVGWRPLELGQPPQTVLWLSSANEVHPHASSSERIIADRAPPNSDVGSFIRIPFECRVFEAPDRIHRELVVWCTFVGGQIFEEGPPPSNVARGVGGMQEGGVEMRFWATCRLAAKQLLQLLQRRTPALAAKQSVCLSAQCNDDWHAALKRIESFAKVSLSLKLHFNGLEPSHKRAALEN